MKRKFGLNTSNNNMTVLTETQGTGTRYMRNTTHKISKVDTILKMSSHLAITFIFANIISLGMLSISALLTLFFLWVNVLLSTTYVVIIFI